MGVPQDPWASILEKDLILDDLGVPTFLETSLNRDWTPQICDIVWT